MTHTLEVVLGMSKNAQRWMNSLREIAHWSAQ
jgi:hypothetical protein